MVLFCVPWSGREESRLHLLLVVAKFKGVFYSQKGALSLHSSYRASKKGCEALPQLFSYNNPSFQIL